MPGYKVNTYTVKLNRSIKGQRGFPFKGEFTVTKGVYQYVEEWAGTSKRGSDSANPYTGRQPEGAYIVLDGIGRVYFKRSILDRKDVERQFTNKARRDSEEHRANTGRGYRYDGFSRTERRYCK